jgi:hypothetical protein
MGYDPAVVTPEQASEPKFEAPVHIGKGLYLSARRGTLTIDHGEFTLRKRDGDVIAQAPIGDVWAAKAVDSLKVWLGSKRFIVRPRTGEVRAPGHLTAAYGARQAARQAKRLNAFAETFLAVAEAEGAHIGKPKSS